MKHKTYNLFIVDLPSGKTELHRRTFEDAQYRQAGAFPILTRGDESGVLDGITQDAALDILNQWNAQAVRNVELKRTQILFTYFI